MRESATRAVLSAIPKSAQDRTRRRGVSRGGYVPSRVLAMTERALNGRVPVDGVRRPVRVRASGSEVAVGEGRFAGLTATLTLLTVHWGLWHYNLSTVVA